MRLLVALLLFVMASVGGICAFEGVRPYLSEADAFRVTLVILLGIVFVVGVIWLVVALLSDSNDRQSNYRKGGRSFSSGSSGGFGGGFGDGGGAGDGGGCGGGDGGGGGCD